jgi:NAD+ diphosphatase
MLTTPENFTPLINPIAAANFMLFAFRGDELLVSLDMRTCPVQGMCKVLDIKPENLHPVGLLDGQYCQCTWLAASAVAPDNFQFVKLRGLFGNMGEDLLSIAGRAYQIAEWARTHRYCGVCATRMQLGSGERCFKCPDCGMTAYPRISPAMMVLIKKGDYILLAKHKASPVKRFIPLAGFLEAGESVEEAIHREVFEEIGIKVKNLQYFSSQSWPFPHSLMIAFTAEYESGELVLDDNEIEEAQWFGPDNPLPPDYPVGLSVSGALVHAHHKKNSIQES